MKTYESSKENQGSEKRFLYRPNMLTMGLASIVLGGASAFVAFTSQTRRLPQALADFLDKLGLNMHVVMSAIGVLGLTLTIAALIAMIYSRLSGKRYIILSSDFLSIPSNFSSKIKEIRFSDILNVEICNVSNQKFIRVVHRSGKIDLAQSMFESKEIFSECHSLILKST